MAFLPARLKDLLQYVPTLLFEVVEWSDLSKELLLLSKRLLSGKDVPDVQVRLTSILPNKIKFSEANFHISPIGDRDRHELGQCILELYFVQMFNKGPMFLDLSQDRFRFDKTSYMWFPSHLWSEFSPSFQIGVRDIYQGFYHEKKDQFRKGLIMCGLVNSKWNEQTIQELENLFINHFGKNIHEKMNFKIKEFQDSFQKIFEFLMLNKVKLNSDFLLLGLMIVTLYTHLEYLNVAVSPLECFNRALGKSTAS